MVFKAVLVENSAKIRSVITSFSPKGRLVLKPLQDGLKLTTEVLPGAQMVLKIEKSAFSSFELNEELKFEVDSEALHFCLDFLSEETGSCARLSCAAASDALELLVQNSTGLVMASRVLKSHDLSVALQEPQLDSDSFRTAVRLKAQLLDASLEVFDAATEPIHILVDQSGVQFSQSSELGQLQVEISKNCEIDCPFGAVEHRYAAPPLRRFQRLLREGAAASMAVHDQGLLQLRAVLGLGEGARGFAECFVEPLLPED